MFAKVIHQDKRIKEEFYRMIEEKKEKERKAIEQKYGNGFLNKIFKTIAIIELESKIQHDETKGSGGENEFKQQMWLLLKSDSFVIPDCVLKVGDEFIQIDSIVINKKGIFLIEIKTWSGSFLASDKNWKMKQGKKWVEVSNPTEQHKRHYVLFKTWLKNNFKDQFKNLESIIYPVIVLKQVDWIKADYSSIPVVSGAMGFIDFILGKPNNQLTDGLIEELVKKLTEYKP